MRFWICCRSGRTGVAHSALSTSGRRPACWLPSVTRIHKQWKEIEHNMRNDQRPQAALPSVPTGQDKAERHDENHTDYSLIKVAKKPDADAHVDRSPWTRTVLECRDQVSAKKQFLKNRIDDRYRDHDSGIDSAFDRVENPSRFEHVT